MDRVDTLYTLRHPQGWIHCSHRNGVEVFRPQATTRDGYTVLPERNTLRAARRALTLFAKQNRS